MKILLSIGAVVLAGIGYWRHEVGEDEIYILPKGYQGAVYVIYNQKSGQANYENGKRLYTVPNDGIVRTRLSPNNDWSNFPKCYYGDNGKRIEIPFEVENQNVKKDILQACCISSGTSFKDPTNEPVAYSMFYIGTGQNIDSAFVREEKRNISKLSE